MNCSVDASHNHDMGTPYHVELLQGGSVACQGRFRSFQLIPSC